MVQLKQSSQQHRSQQQGQQGRRTTRKSPCLSPKDLPTVTTTTFLPLNQNTKGLILWDVENLKPFLPLSSLPAQVNRIQSFFQKSGCGEVEVVTALNPRSLAACKESGVWALLKACDVEVLDTPDHPDAADVALVSRGYEAVQQVLANKSDNSHTSTETTSNASNQSAPHSNTGTKETPSTQSGPLVQQESTGTSNHRSPGTDDVTSVQALDNSKPQLPLAVVCFSQDARFAQLLAYAADRGIYAVTMGPFKQGLRTANAKLNSPGLHMQQNPLCIASCAAVKWTDEVSALTGHEKQYIQQAREKAISIHAGSVDGKPDCSSVRLPAALRDDLEALSQAPGKVGAVWLNRKFLN